MYIYIFIFVCIYIFIFISTLWFGTQGTNNFIASRMRITTNHHNVDNLLSSPTNSWDFGIDSRWNSTSSPHRRSMAFLIGITWVLRRECTLPSINDLINEIVHNLVSSLVVVAVVFCRSAQLISTVQQYNNILRTIHSYCIFQSFFASGTPSGGVVGVTGMLWRCVLGDPSMNRYYNIILVFLIGHDIIQRDRVLQSRATDSSTLLVQSTCLDAWVCVWMSSWG